MHQEAGEPGSRTSPAWEPGAGRDPGWGWEGWGRCRRAPGCEGACTGGGWSAGMSLGTSRLVGGERPCSTNAASDSTPSPHAAPA